ncbi:hypothetical protein LTS18_007434, partial [Coniosporium uncinatum]
MSSKSMVGDDSKREEEQIELLADLPEDLEKEMIELDKLFRVDTETLKKVVERFQEELQEGLDASGTNIPMNITWVLGFPTGHEQGSFLTLDLGGTNIRTCWITLAGREGETKILQDQHKLPRGIKTGSAEELWEFIAESLKKFISDNKLGGSKEDPLRLGFTFSYPASQDYIDHGVLQTWTKGWDIKGVEGEDVAGQLQAALDERDLPVRIVALVNDTTGAMIASAYNDPETIIGSIFGTGCNAAYMDDCDSIGKAKDLPKNTPMAINCEYGAFDNDRRVLPLTPYDEQIDRDSPRPGEQAFEKMSAGLYLGEIFRLVLIELNKKGLAFTGQSIDKLQQPYSIDTSILSRIEDDESP